jgi:hypothetical protein
MAAALALFTARSEKFGGGRLSKASLVQKYSCISI